MNLGEKIIDFNLFGVDGSYFSVSNMSIGNMWVV